MTNGFVVPMGFLLFPVEPQARPPDPTPLLQPHYQPSSRLRLVRRCTGSTSNRQLDAKNAFGTHRTEATMRTAGPTCVAPLKEHIMFAALSEKLGSLFSPSHYD